MRNKRKIVISLIAIVFIGFVIINDSEDLSGPNRSSPFLPPQTPLLNNSYSLPHDPSSREISSSDRREVLKKSVNGYREQTYWGSEHPLDERIEDFDDKEFSDFIENEGKSKDVDLYWGAEY